MRQGRLVIAVLLGIGLAWVDTRPGWDDTGVTVGAIVLASATIAAFDPRRPWLTALALGIWIPLAEIRNPGALLALAFALAGAYGGSGLRKLLAPAS